MDDGTTAEARRHVNLTELPGKRVRVVLEGWMKDRNTLTSEDPHSDRTAYSQRVDLDTPLVASVEVLPDPEPAWWPPQPGDVVRLGRVPGSVWVRGPQQWHYPDTSGCRDDEMLARLRHDGEVTLLVRGGKPYVAQDRDTENVRASGGRIEYQAGVSQAPEPHPSQAQAVLDTEDPRKMVSVWVHDLRMLLTAYLATPHPPGGRPWDTIHRLQQAERHA